MSWRLSASEAALLVVDAQEKLVAAVKEPSDWLERLEILVKGASLLGVPIAITGIAPSSDAPTPATVST